MPGKAPTGLELSELFDGCYDVREGVPEFRLFVDGRWSPAAGGRLLDVDSPIDGSVIARVQAGAAADAENAVGAAYRARKPIRDIPGIDRIDMLNKARHILQDHRDDFVGTMVLEAGKPVHMAEAEVRAAINRIKMTMEEARKIFGEYVPGDWSEDTMAKFALVIHEPLGVIACVSPFNYPLFSVVAKVIPALGIGNAVVVKPASDDPVVSLLFGRSCRRRGSPPGPSTSSPGQGRRSGSRWSTTTTSA